MNTSPTFSEALARLRARRGLTMQEAADLLGVHWRSVQNWENGTSSPSRAKQEAYLDALSPDAAGSDAAADPLLSIPGGSEAGAGPARDNGHASVEIVQITRAEVERVTGLGGPALGRLRWFTVAGDSMAPDLRPGERVFYTPCDAFGADGYYVAEMDGERLVKRIQRHGGGVLDLVPVNPDYQTERLIPLPGADTPNLYRSDLSGATVLLVPVGKVNFNFMAR